MRLYLYKAKRNPLKSVSPELPEVHCIGGNIGGPCNEARKSVNVTTVPFTKHYIEGTPCLPPCAKTVPAGKLTRPKYNCKGTTLVI